MSDKHVKCPSCDLGKVTIALDGSPEFPCHICNGSGWLLLDDYKETMIKKWLEAEDEKQQLLQRNAKLEAAFIRLAEKMGGYECPALWFGWGDSAPQWCRDGSRPENDGDLSKPDCYEDEKKCWRKWAENY